MPWFDVAGESEIAPGEFKLVDVEEIELALFNVDGSICCIEDLCTHDGGNLVEGDFDGKVVTCPRHGAKFDVCTGQALCLPAVMATPVHATRIRDGRIEVEITEEDLG